MPYSGGEIVALVRALRPLRALQYSPPMNFIFKTLFHSLPQLGNVCIIWTFSIIIYSIIGLQLFDGIETYRCRLVSENTTYWPIDPNYNWLCGYASCPDPGYTCAQGPKNWTEVDNEDFNYGIENFDIFY